MLSPAPALASRAPDPAEPLQGELREIHEWRTRIPLQGVEPSFSERCEIEGLHRERIPRLVAEIRALPPRPQLALSLARTGLPDPLLVDAFAGFLARCEISDALAVEIVAALALYHLRYAALALESAPPHIPETALAYRQRLRPGDILPTLASLTSGRPSFGAAFAEAWQDDPEHTLDTLSWMAVQIASRSSTLADPRRDELAHHLLERARRHPACTPLERIRLATLRRAHLLACVDPYADLLVFRAVGIVGRGLDSDEAANLAAALIVLEESAHPPAALGEILQSFPRLTVVQAARTACDLLTI